MTTARLSPRTLLKLLPLVGVAALVVAVLAAALSGSGGAALRGFAYVANCGSNDVSVLDLSSNAVIETIPVGTCPWGVVFTPNGQKAYVTNHGSRTVSVVDTAPHPAIDTDGNPRNGITRIPVGTNAQGLGGAPDGTSVYVSSGASKK